MKREYVTWTVLIQIQLCIFLRALFRFRFIACIQIQIKALVGVYIPPFEYFAKVGFSWLSRSEKTLRTRFALTALTGKFLCFHVFSQVAQA